MYRVVVIVQCALGVLVTADTLCYNRGDRLSPTEKLIVAEYNACLTMATALNETVRGSICRKLGETAQFTNMTNEELSEVWSARKKQVLADHSELADPINLLFTDMHGYSEALATVSTYEKKMEDGQVRQQYEKIRQGCHASETTLYKFLEIRKKVVATLPRLHSEEEFAASWNQTAVEIAAVIHPDAKPAADCLLKQTVIVCKAVAAAVKGAKATLHRQAHVAHTAAHHTKKHS